MATIRQIFEVHRVPKRMMEQTVPEISIEEIDGRKVKRITGFKKETVEVKGGFMVYFPRGHSIFVDSEGGLATFGLLNDDGSVRTGKVDMETGEPVEDQTPVSLKDSLERKQASRKQVTLEDLAAE
jgi:hypothetical protein